MSEIDGLLVKTNNETRNFKILRIASDEANVTGTSGNFTINFGNDSDLDNVYEIRLLSASIVNQVYNICAAESNNSFVVTHSVDGEVTMTIPDGQYTVDQLMTQMKTSLDAAVTGTYTVVQSDTTGLISITASSGTISVSTINGFAKAIGFVSVPSTASTITATALPNLIGTRMLHIHCPQLAQTNKTLIAGGTGVNGIVSIPVDVPFGACQTYVGRKHDTLIFGSKFINRSVRNLQFIIRGNLGRELTEMTLNLPTVLVFKIFY